VWKGEKVNQLAKHKFLEGRESINQRLKRMGRADLIGNGKGHLVPAWQPAGTGEQREDQRITPKAKQSFCNQHSRAEKSDHKTGKGRKSTHGHKNTVIDRYNKGCLRP